MQAKAIMKKDSTVKIRYSGIKFLYISSSASHKPFLCEQRIRKRKLFIPTHTKLVSASHSEHNSSFHIKAKSNIFFYNSTDIMSIGGRRRRKEEQKKKWNQQVVFFFFFPNTTFHSPMIFSAQTNFQFSTCIPFHDPSSLLNLSKINYPSCSGTSEFRHSCSHLIQTCSEFPMAPCISYFALLTPFTYSS